jgi:hypothetical protein
MACYSLVPTVSSWFAEAVGPCRYNWMPLYLEQQRGQPMAVTGAILAAADMFMVGGAHTSGTRLLVERANTNSCKNPTPRAAGALSGGFFADWMRNAPRFRVWPAATTANPMTTRASSKVRLHQFPSDCVSTSQGTRYSDVNWIRRTSIIVSRSLGGLMCLLLSLETPVELIIGLIFLYNIINEFISNWSGALPQDMSYKYAAAIQGICNTGSNITYYALSANIMCATPPMAGAC